MNTPANKTSKRNTIYGICLLVLSLALAAGTQTVFHACGIHDDGSYGRCHYAQLVIGCVGLLMAVGSVLMLVFRTREVSIALSVLTICESVFALLLPDKIIPLCMMATMSCQAKMKPFTLVMSIVILLAAGCNLVSKLIKK